jgi:hypothetical protein
MPLKQGDATLHGKPAFSRPSADDDLLKEEVRSFIAI